MPQFRSTAKLTNFLERLRSPALFGPGSDRGYAQQWFSKVPATAPASFSNCPSQVTGSVVACGVAQPAICETINGRSALFVRERFRFRFELDAASDIQPWGEPGRYSLNWFGLTSGRYWIETPLGEVLRYTPEIRKLWNIPFFYVDYQVARMFEDLQEHLPAALEPVPEDIATLATSRTWLKQLSLWADEECSELEGRQRWNLYEAAMWWWWQRELDTSHLSHGPRISMWRTRDEVHFRWTTNENEDRDVPVFTVPTGDLTMGLKTFQAAATDFCNDVLSAMRRRIESIQNNGWIRRDCTLDLSGLAAEQKHREEIFRQVSAKVLETDWLEVRTQLRALNSQMGPGA
jgi:hypothetical protein